jgi:hypothetical protein
MLTSKSVWMNVGLTLAVIAVGMRVEPVRSFVLAN